MARGGRSSSSSKTSRSTAAAVKPPQKTQQPMSGGMGGGIMSSIMSGMAFGAASEMMRGLFRNESTGPFMLPLLFSGLTTWGTRRFLLKNHPFKLHISFLVFGSTFFIAYKMLSKNSNEDDYERH